VEDGDGPCFRCGRCDDGEIGKAGGGGVAAGGVFAEGVDAIAVGVVGGISEAEGCEPRGEGDGVGAERAAAGLGGGAPAERLVRSGAWGDGDEAGAVAIGVVWPEA
jgi:hypothetical protein